MIHDSDPDELRLLVAVLALGLVRYRNAPHRVQTEARSRVAKTAHDIGPVKSDKVFNLIATLMVNDIRAPGAKSALAPLVPRVVDAAKKAGLETKAVGDGININKAAADAFNRGEDKYRVEVLGQRPLLPDEPKVEQLTPPGLPMRAREAVPDPTIGPPMEEEQMEGKDDP